MEAVKFLWRELLDLVFPWSCPLCGGQGSPPHGSCPACLDRLTAGPAWRCLRCGGLEPASGGPCCPRGPDDHLDGLLAVCDYAGEARRLVLLLKYARRPLAARLMGHLLEQALAESLDSPCDAVVPVPLHRSRLAERGFNQAALIARPVGQGLGVRVDYAVLRRVRETAGQAGLGPEIRRSNVTGAFRASGAAAGLRLLLLDDVYTTGATMNECARALREAGAASVLGVVFACARARAGGWPGLPSDP